jgi:hypothetical protein
MQLFVMDWANNAMTNSPYNYSTKFWDKTVQKATMFEINTAIMRCITKNLAIFWLGINIYAGEDLPLIDEEWNTVEKKITHTPKAKPYGKQQDEFGLDLDDYIASIAMEKDSESLKLLYTRWLKLCISEKQSSYFSSIKDKRKKELWL